jgi:hypothetical protein
MPDPATRIKLALFAILIALLLLTQEVPTP